MDAGELLERYESFDDESLYDKAKPLYERAVAESPGDAWLLRQYGYLQECHGRRSLRRAADLYERAVEADPGGEKAHAQLISALAALGAADEAISRYRKRLASNPRDPGAHRLLAQACLKPPRAPEPLGRGGWGVAIHRRLERGTRVHHRGRLAQT